MTDTTFTPAFTQTDSISASLAEIERNAWLIEHMLLMPRYEAWIHREVTYERASATTRIEGIGEDEDERTPDSVRKTTEQANANAVRAYEFIDYVSDLKDQPLDELVLRQINREFLHGAPATLTPGVYRKGQNTVGLYSPPDQGDVPSLMRQFVDWLQHGAEHPVLAAGIAHLHFVAIHPFWDGNGRTARALEALILQRSEFHFRKLLSMEKRLLSVRPHYFAAIEHTLGRAFGPYDATQWLEFYTATLALEVRELVGRLTTWHRHLENLYRAANEVGLQPRHADGMAFLLRLGQMTRSDYRDITGVSPVTASRDLKQLVDRDWIVPEGQTAARIYRPSEMMKETMENTTTRPTPEEQINPPGMTAADPEE